MNEIPLRDDATFERSKNRAGLIVFGSIVLTVLGLFLTIRLRSSDVLLNVSYDASHRFFHNLDHLYSKENPEIRIRSSHGGSVEQGGSVLRGLKVDVVTLASAAEIDAISKSGLISPQWRTQFPHGSSPFSSTIIFLVRPGNPKNIMDWNDLIRKDVSVVIPSPKVSGAGRWAFLAAWNYSMEQKDDEATAELFVQQLYSRKPVVNKGARSALVAFVSQNEGDVLVTWENEAWYARERHGTGEVQIIYPSVSIVAEPAVAVVERFAEERNTTAQANDYLKFLFSEAGQKAALRNYLRPRDPNLPLWDSTITSNTRLISIEDRFGSWENALNKHFSEGGTFDRIDQANR